MAERGTLPFGGDLNAIVRELDFRARNLERDFIALKGSLTMVLYAAPDKPREGNFAFADGTTWNPGSGRGLYQYVSGAWVKL